MFTGWVFRATTTLSPDGRSAFLRLDVLRHDVLEPTEARSLNDGVNGVLHLPRLAAASVHADLLLEDETPVTLAMGEDAEGRPLRLVVSRRSASSAP